MQNIHILQKEIKQMQSALELKKKKLEMEKKKSSKKNDKNSNKKKECPPDKFFNQKTNRCLKRKKCTGKKTYDSTTNKCIFLEKTHSLYWDQEKKLKKYVGKMKDGKRNGKGIEYYDDGKTKEYEGEWKDDKKNGKGIDYDKNGIKKYEGEWENGKRNGKGIEYHENKNKNYDGEWENGKRNGKGNEYYYNGNKKYDGEWKTDMRNGLGMEYFYDKVEEKYNGEWENGKRNGKGIEYYYNKGNKKYDGDWENGMRNGKGTEYNENGNKSYEGEWNDGKWHGKGTSYRKENGKMILFKGNFKNGEKQCPPNKLLNENDMCVTKKKCGKKYLYDEKKNLCIKRRILLKSNVLGKNVKWFKGTSTPSASSSIIAPLKQINDVSSFGSELIDKDWIKKQYKYYQKLDVSDKIFLLVYTDYGDVLINRFLSDGVKGININTIFDKDFDYTINPFFPIFLKHPEIFLNSTVKVSDPDMILNSSKELRKKILNKKLSINERYKEFQKLFKKYFTKEFLEDALEIYMNKFNENLNRIISKSPKLKKEMLVARGSKQELNYDDKWTNRFTSTSLKSAVAKKFSGGGGHIDIYILKPGTPCIPLFLTRYEGEIEILLGSGCCRYKIEKKEEMKQVQELAKKQFSYPDSSLNMRFYEVSKKN
jgi:antitoxin component YwqK of YwqJK toxin-antitoxin module